MYKLLFSLLLITSILNGGEYDFDMDAIEHKPYEYSGYLRLEDKPYRINNSEEDLQNYVHLEALVNFSYTYEMFKFKTSLMATSDYVKDKINDNNVQANDLYVEVKLNTNHNFLLGKESLQWGKGYFFNPIAFFDRLKDPTQPAEVREGFVITKYSYNKSFSSELKNLSFDFVYLPSTETLNKDYYQAITNSQDANNVAMRLYLLLYDTDVDLIYNYSDNASDKIGIDFSKNIQTNFEIHGEYANVLDSGDSYLLGFRYLTDSDLTIISEYLYRSMGLTKEEIELSTATLPFIAKNYAITLVTQKEPFEWLYSSIYYKNMLNLQDISQQNKLGLTYAFKNNINLDFSYNLNSGGSLSEFGKKAVKDFLWLRLSWNY